MGSLLHLAVKCLLDARAGLDTLDAPPKLLGKCCSMRTCLSLLHQGPFLIYHDLGVGCSGLLNLVSLLWGELVGKPVNLHYVAGFALRCIVGCSADEAQRIPKLRIFGRAALARWPSLGAPPRWSARSTGRVFGPTRGSFRAPAGWFFVRRLCRLLSGCFRVLLHPAI